MTTLQYIHEVVTALPRRIVDGDTWYAYVDLGYRQLGHFEYRLMGWDTPEKQGPATSRMEREQAKVATQTAVDWWADQIKAGGRRLYIKSEKDPERYGRWLGTLWAESPAGEQWFLGEQLAQHGLAVPSNGTAGTRWRDTYNPWRTP